MAISTKGNNNVGLSKKEKIENLFQYHANTFKVLDIESPLYIPKMFYRTPKVAKFFRSEMIKGQDIYTELVSKDYNSEDPSRTLYRLPYRENYHDLYSHVSLGFDTSEVCYEIPLSEFEIVEQFDDEDTFDLGNPDDDAPFEDMTIKDYCAIVWRKPISNRAWLNEFISKHNPKSK